MIESCRMLFRQHDWERYMLSLYLPQPLREKVWVLGAFNTEIARVAETVSELHIGAIRLKWWLEVLEQIAAGEPVREHPVALALAELNLPLDPLTRMITAREADLRKGVVFADIAALDDYATVTGAALWLPLAQEEASRNFLQQLGQLWALQGLLRTTGIHLQQGRTMIPRKVLAAHNIAEATLFSPQPPIETLMHIVESLAIRIEPSLAMLRKQLADMPKDLRPFGLALELIAKHLRKLTHSPQQALTLSPRPQKLGVQWCLLKGSLKLT